jgi:hypothetical protein
VYASAENLRKIQTLAFQVKIGYLWMGSRLKKLPPGLYKELEWK